MTWADIVDFSQTQRVRNFSRLALIGFVVCLGVATHWPNPRISAIARFWSADKVMHFSAYAILTALLVWTCHTSGWSLLAWARRVRMQSVLIVLCVLVLGSIDEITQPLVGRTCSIWDLAADVSGSVFTLTCVAMVQWFPLRSILRSLLPHEPLQTR